MLFIRTTGAAFPDRAGSLRLRPSGLLHHPARTRHVRAVEDPPRGDLPCKRLRQPALFPPRRGGEPVTGSLRQRYDAAPARANPGVSKYLARMRHLRAERLVAVILDQLQTNLRSHRCSPLPASERLRTSPETCGMNRAQIGPSMSLRHVRPCPHVASSVTSNLRQG